jgi:hypothetical protein
VRSYNHCCSGKVKISTKLGRAFKSDHGGFCIYVKTHMQTKKINYLTGINKEKDFELTAVEILDYKLIVCVCVDYLMVISLHC